MLPKLEGMSSQSGDQVLCDGTESFMMGPPRLSQAIKTASRSTGENIGAFCLLSSVLKS